ncbi:LOW QUALITY PROTEIN: hypothetical protein ACHAXS_009407 [Conticribra weissflogii]
MLEEIDVWEVVDWKKVLSSTWVFESNRFPDGLIKKFKARFCACGDKPIEGKYFFEIFAPMFSKETSPVHFFMLIFLKKSKHGDAHRIQTRQQIRSDLGAEVKVNTAWFVPESDGNLEVHD